MFQHPAASVQSTLLRQFKSTLVRQFKAPYAGLPIVPGGCYETWSPLGDFLDRPDRLPSVLITKLRVAPAGRRRRGVVHEQDWTLCIGLRTLG
jgi:hypothetical protein